MRLILALSDMSSKYSLIFLFSRRIVPTRWPSLVKMFLQTSALQIARDVALCDVQATSSILPSLTFLEHTPRAIGTVHKLMAKIQNIIALVKLRRFTQQRILMKKHHAMNFDLLDAHSIHTATSNCSEIECKRCYS